MLENLELKENALVSMELHATTHIAITHVLSSS